MLDHLFVSEDLGFRFLLDVAFKATLVLLLASLTVVLLFRSSAALRHRIWVVSLAGLLFLPAVIALAPQVTWEIVPPSWEQRPVLQSALSGPQSEIAPTEAPVEQGPIRSIESDADVDPDTQTMLPASEPTLLSNALVEEPKLSAQLPPPTTDTTGEDRPASISPLAWIGPIWLAGTLVALLPLACGLVGNLRLRITARRLDDPQWQRLLETFSERLGLRRKVTLLLCEPEQMPMTFGLWNPCVALPHDALQWSAERREVVLLHELAHIKRWDVPLQVVARFASSLYWFHPLVWWAMRRLRLEREHACDDCVLQAGQEADRYATELLEIAHSHRRRSVMLNAALSMARQSQLEGRLLAVLDEQRCRTQVGAARAGGLALVAIAVVAVLGVVRPTFESSTLASDTEASLVATVTSGKPDVDPRQQLVITGSVLSPEGEPLPGASVEVVAYDQTHFSLNLPWQEGIDHYPTQADDAGRFSLVLGRDVSLPRRQMLAVASAEGFAVTSHSVDPRLTSVELEIKLHEVRKVSLRVIDTAGNPLPGVELKLIWPDLLGAVSNWPRFAPTDEEGNTSVKVSSSTKKLWLTIDDERYGAHFLGVDVSDAPVSVALPPTQFLTGKVIDRENGEPIAGAEVAVMERPYRRVLTDADGNFRIAKGTTPAGLFRKGESIVQVYPPPDSHYLFQALEWNWPDDGLGDAEMTIKLRRGVVVSGQVIERGTGNPVAGAAIYFDPQRRSNLLYREDATSRFSGSDMKYICDDQGRFRLPIWPGPGYLLVRAPTLDYVHQQVSLGEKWYGKPGLEREYYDGALRMRLRRGEQPEPVTIELERGVTLRRTVVRPDGEPATGQAHARSYLQDKDSVSSSLPAMPIVDGILELPGFDPESSNPVYILDRKHHCGTTVMLGAAEVTLEDPPIQLRACGSASFRFLDDQGNALSDFEPYVVLIVTPGAPATHHIESRQPLWADSVFWQNVIHPDKVAKTDADGRVTVPDLIPGANYAVSFINKDETWDHGYEFTVRAGETTEVGEIVLPRRE